MTRSETTKFLSDLLIRDRLSGIGKYYASEVTLDWGKGKGKEKRIDFLQFSPESQLCVGDIEKGIFTCYEVKSCKEDVFSGNGLNFIGEKNYIVTTMECWKDIMSDFMKLQQHIMNCNPESSITFGIMIARPFPRSLTDEFENPTPLESDAHWTLEVLKPCRESYRRRSMSELLFYMLRSGR